jgi:hypothetical protein
MDFASDDVARLGYPALESLAITELAFLPVGIAEQRLGIGLQLIGGYGLCPSYPRLIGTQKLRGIDT